MTNATLTEQTAVVPKPPPRPTVLTKPIESPWRFISRHAVAGYPATSYGDFELRRFALDGYMDCVLAGPVAAMRPHFLPDVFQDLIDLAKPHVEAHADVIAWREHLERVKATRQALTDAEREAAADAEASKSNDPQAIRAACGSAAVARELRFRLDSVITAARELHGKAEKAAAVAYTKAVSAYASELRPQREQLTRELASAIGAVLEKHLPKLLSVREAGNLLQRLADPGTPAPTARLLGSGEYD